MLCFFIFEIVVVKCINIKGVLASYNLLNSKICHFFRVTTKRGSVARTDDSKRHKITFTIIISFVLKIWEIAQVRIKCIFIRVRITSGYYNSYFFATRVGWTRIRETGYGRYGFDLQFWGGGEGNNSLFYSAPRNVFVKLKKSTSTTNTPLGRFLRRARCRRTKTTKNRCCAMYVRITSRRQVKQYNS